MAATGKVLGTVTSVVGEAKATAADGTVRILQVGDVVHSDETITTSAARAQQAAATSDSRTAAEAAPWWRTIPPRTA